MNKPTTNELDYELLEHITKNAFGMKPTKIIQLNEGSFKANYKVLVPDGRCAVLKIAPRDDTKVMRYEKNMLYTEMSVMQKIRRHTLVPVPNIYYFDAAHTSCPADYMFMEYIDAPTYSTLYDSMSKEERDHIEEEIGRVNRSINQIHGHLFGYYGQERRQKSTWYEAFSRMLEDSLLDAKLFNVPLGLDEMVFYRLLERDKNYFDDILEPSLVHWRLWERNCYVRDGKIVGITDWEHCIWADPLMEFGFRTGYCTDEFLRGYEKESFSDREKRRMLWYDFYLSLTMVVEIYARGNEKSKSKDEVWDRYCHYLELIRETQNQTV